MPLIIVWEPGVLGRFRESMKRALRRLFRSKIFDAIERGDRSLVNRLATPRRLRSARSEFGALPLSASIAARQTAIACDLIARAAWVPGEAMVASAILASDLVVLSKLIEAGASVEEPLQCRDGLDKGWTPLMWATNRHNFAAMTLLLQAGAQIDARAEDGTTAVMCAAKGRDDDLVALDLLCAHQPSLTTKDWRGRTILDEARDRARFSNKTAMLDVLQRHYPGLCADETDQGREDQSPGQPL